MNNFMKTIFYLLLLLSFIQVGRSQGLALNENNLTAGKLTTENLRKIRLDEFRKIILLDGKSISTNEMLFVDLREDQSIDMIYLKDNTVIDRIDIYTAGDINKGPREDDRISPENLRITIPANLKRELLLGVDGGGMTIPEDLLKNTKMK
ncbi:MAG: hypothetical protein HN576_05715 [Bacteriovoracaceae bacterium]|jgi:hypothetical protein|nr:hypothetical protein [Bacteriovoracaceae bacterium]